MKRPGRNHIREIIDLHLYPAEKFPRSLFPDLVPLLTELCLRDGPLPGGEDPETAVSHRVSLKTLLMKDPGTLVLLYRNLIRKYIFKRHIIKEEVEEIVQEVITRLLKEKIRAIRKRFNFDNPRLPTFTSYFMVTIRNIYIDILRKESRGKNLVESDSEIETIGDTKRTDMINTLILEEEFKKLNALLKLYHKTAPRLNLTLKIKFNIPLEESDVLRCFPDCSEEDMIHLLKQGGSKRFTGRKSMEKIVPVFNKYEGKSNNPDTLRKWISTKLEELKRQMNHVHPQRPYNNSTISDLIVLYFGWKKGEGE